MPKVVRSFVNLLASYGLAVVLLFFLALLTFLGTLAQVQMGLYEAQKKYFESFYVVHEFWDIPVLLPGAYLLMALLFVNLLLGAILRAPKSWRRPGMLIAHGGILFMLLGGLITYEFSTRGYMRLYEGERSNQFESYYDWELAVIELDGEGRAREYVIPDDYLTDPGPDGRRTFHDDGLPFDLLVEGFLQNCRPAPASAAAQGIDGFWLQPLAPEKEAETNAAGAYATAMPKDGGASVSGILFGYARAPWTFEMDGRRWAVDLRKKRWQVPFTIVLDRFIHETHPGTMMASNYESEVTQIENGVPRKVNIRMNEPLRHEGYTFFQASYGPKNARPGERMFSVFEVVRNPADQWPLYACIVITIGLALHFIQRLLAHIKRQNRRQA